jgi:hypothetical protein
MHSKFRYDNYGPAGDEAATVLVAKVACGHLRPLEIISYDKINSVEIALDIQALA